MNSITTVGQLIQLLQKVQEKTGPDTKVSFFQHNHFSDCNDIPNCDDEINDTVYTAKLRGEINMMNENSMITDNPTLYLGIG
jgi:hypothetical protein